MATDSIVNSLVWFWRQPYSRTYLPYLFVFISFAGSVLKSMDLVPESYFSNSRNLLNLYFVKISWGWTMVLLLPFICLSNYNKNETFVVLRRLTSLLVSSLVWYTCTETFFYIEDITGSCSGSDTMEVLAKLTTKADCRKAGFTWDGFDISGHSFILTYSTLVIVEEMVPMLHLAHMPSYSLLECIYIALNVIVAIWMWMFICTSVYFHDLIDKILGTSCGVLGWYLTYIVWYPKSFSPGLPPQQKQHA